MDMRRTIPLLVLAVAPGLLLSQTTLVPAWSHTWSFGQDATPIISVPLIGSSQDNHVAVDASSGIIYATVDDQFEQDSPHHDYLFSFDETGVDLTPVPTPLLGSATIGEDGAPENIESTRDLVVRNGIMFHHRELNLGFFTNGTVGNILVQNALGEQWRLGLGRGYVQRGILLVDADGLVVVRNTDGTGIHALDANGWLQWSVPAPGSVRDAVLVGSEIIVFEDGQAFRYDRASGSSSGPPVQLFSNGSGQIIATDGQRIFYAYSLFGGGSVWACADLDGNVLWEHSLPDELTFTEMEVDGYGRPWLIGNPLSAGEPPLLIVTGSDGGSYETFTYGATMNDIALGDGQAYITGQLTNGDNTTYLIALGTEISTGAAATKPSPSNFTLYPTPASNTLSIKGSGRFLNSKVFDATGQQVVAPALTSNTLDVSDLATGVYFLEAQTANGSFTRRFTVTR